MFFPPPTHATSRPARKVFVKSFCESYEQLLSKYERYVSLVFSGRIAIQSREEGNLVYIAGLDYKKFRLFGLSILWRAAVAREKMFQCVDLGPHQEKLRQQLLREDPGPPHRYGFFLSPLLWDDRDINDLIVKPTRARLGGNRCYRFVFGGLIWVFVVSSHAPPKAFRQAFLNEQGQMLMLKSEMKDVAFIVDAMEEMVSKRSG